jgi:integral membrane sensor domain MASE1/DNA-binding CsgD family transcriptional regulator
MRCPNKSSGNGRDPPRAHAIGSDVVALILVGIAYFTLAYLGLRFASINSSATPIWPPTGLAIAAMLLWGHRIAPAIFVAAFLINQLTAGSIFTSLAIGSGNTLEAVIAGYLVRHWAEGEQVFDTPTGIAKFTLISLTVTLVSATIGVGSLTVAGYAEVSNFISVWLTWWFGDVAGALVVAPVVVLWAKSEPASLRPPQITRTGLTYLATVAAGVIAFTPLLHHTLARDALAFLVVPPLLWASLRQGSRDTATVALIISAFAVWCTVMQCGPFSKPSLEESFILSLAFMISAAVLSLTLSADVAVRRDAENKLRQRAFETEVLWQATVQVAFGGSFENLLRGCLGRICRVTGWPAGHVYVPDNINDPRRLLPSPVWHFEREELAPLARETAGDALVVGEGLPCKVCEPNKESLHDICIPILLKPRKRLLLKHGLQAAFGFPLCSEGKLQAVLEFFSETNQPPDQHVLYVVQSIGEQLGRLLERQQGQEQQRQAIAIADVLNLTSIRSGALEAMLNALAASVYLADCDGRVVYMNRAAERQVGTGNVIRIANGRLAPVDCEASLTLGRAIDMAIGDGDVLTGGITVALAGVDHAGLIATILPLSPGENQSSCRGAGMAAIFMQDPIVMPPSAAEAFAQLYRLTGSELRMLLAMVPGLSVKEAAEMLGICENTAKTHLQHIYSKTGTSKQTELMRLFMSATPPISPELIRLFMSATPPVSSRAPRQNTGSKAQSRKAALPAGEKTSALALRPKA